MARPGTADGPRRCHATSHGRRFRNGGKRATRAAALGVGRRTRPVAASSVRRVILPGWTLLRRRGTGAAAGRGGRGGLGSARPGSTAVPFRLPAGSRPRTAGLHLRPRCGSAERGRSKGGLTVERQQCREELRVKAAEKVARGAGRGGLVDRPGRSASSGSPISVRTSWVSVEADRCRSGQRTQGNSPALCPPSRTALLPTGRTGGSRGARQSRGARHCRRTPRDVRSPYDDLGAAVTGCE